MRLAILGLVGVSCFGQILAPIVSSGPPPKIITSGLTYQYSTAPNNNWVLYSQDLGNAAWTPLGGGTGSTPTVTSNAAVAPDGTTTATQIDVSAVSGASPSSNYSFVYQIYSTTSLTPYSTYGYVVSAWMKAASGTHTAYLAASPDGVSYSTGTCTCTTTWQLISFTTPDPTYTLVDVGVDLRDAAQSGQSAQTIYVWGARIAPNKPWGKGGSYSISTTGPQLLDSSSNTNNAICSLQQQLESDYGVVFNVSSNCATASVSNIFAAGGNDFTVQTQFGGYTVSTTQLVWMYGPNTTDNAVSLEIGSGNTLVVYTGGGAFWDTGLTSVRGPTIVTLRYTASSHTMTATMNNAIGSQVSDTSRTLNLTSPSTLTIAAQTGGAFPFGGTFNQLLIYNRRLSDGEVLSNNTALNRASPISAYLWFQGDSLTFGQGITRPNQTYPWQTETDLLTAGYNGYPYANTGVSGQTAASILSEFPSNGVSISGVKNIMILLAGINDLFGGATAATTYSTLQSIWSDARAAGMKVVACTLTPAATVTDSTTQALNTLIKSDMTLYDALADYRADANLGNPTCTVGVGNTWYQTDCVHWTATGAGVAAGIAETAIASLR